MSAVAIAERRKLLVQDLTERDADVFLSDSVPDIRYYTGCMDAGGFLLVTRDGDALLITNAHDAPQAESEAIDARVLVWRPGEDPTRLLYTALRNHTGRAVASSLPATLMLGLESQGIAVELAPGVTSHLRRVKEPAEMDVIRQAARIVEAGMAAARAALRPGVREIEVATEAERAMRQMGMDGRVFESKVESGPRSAMPSTYAGQRALEAGDLVLIDLGPTYRGYFGDLTRTFAVGEPSADRLALLELVLNAQHAALDSASAGVRGHDVDEAARRVVRSAGREDGFLHNTGHSLGLAGDSLPLLMPHASAPLLSGECVTVEPGVYAPGRGGVRIEDEILVTSDGYELLTSFPKTLESLIVHA